MPPVSEFEEFGVESVLNGDRATVSVRGELDLATKPVLVEALAAVVAGGARHVVVDMSGVSFVDSTGLAAILEARRVGASITLRNPVGRVRKLLELVLRQATLAL